MNREVPSVGAQIVEQVSARITLPVPQGLPEFVIYAPSVEAVLECAGLEKAGRDTTKDPEERASDVEVIREGVETLEKVAKRLIELGARTEPPLSFEAEPVDGTVRWRDLHLGNRRALVEAVSHLTLHGTIDGPVGLGRAYVAGTFPSERERGRAGGAAAGAAQPDGPVAE